MSAQLSERTGERAWVAAGTELFVAELAKVEDFASPTALPGWSVGHLAAHVHFNAEALRRLVSWAASGVESRMYASADQRAEEIESGSRRAPDELRDLVAESAAGLAADLDALDEAAWDAEVITAQGRSIPARQIPWLRAREVMVHAIDLGTGLTFEDLPPDFTTELLVDVVRKRARAGEGPALAAWLAGRTTTAPALGPWL
ncbi:maleylpyruvate isomerase family mycothiol-dependent enzyme [Nocardioides sp. NPDC051685]|uniref:maleylpyruvate isomerase family mycothiol-dependent enzyme n=1 Tax=Nocardioides sp. NPDC051685 TaxID=3364334 RepID=UPI0037990B5E